MLNFCKEWSPEENERFLDACRRKKIEYCQKFGLPIPETWDTLQDYMTENKRLHVTVQCMAVYDSYIDVPACYSLDDAIEYAKDNLHEIPLGQMEYVQDSDILDEENCDFAW